MVYLKKVIAMSALAATALYGNWSEVAKVMGDPTSAVSFGYSIDIDGQYAAVGDPGENAVYVFKADTNGTWLPFDKIVSPSTAIALSQFSFFNIGTDLAIDDQSDVLGNDVVLAIGSPKVNRITLGSLYKCSGILVYRLNDTNDGFDLNTTFLTSDYNTSGSAVDLDSYAKATIQDLQLIWHVTEIVASGKPSSGEVELHYYSDQTDWNQTVITPSAGNGIRFGESVALSIEGAQWYLAVGAPGEDVTYTDRNGSTTTFQGKGAAYLYRLDEGIDPGDPWITANDEYRLHQTMPIYLTLDQGIVEDSAFGIAVDLENNDTTYDTVRLIVGAEKENVGYKDRLGNITADEGEASVFAMTAPPPSWAWDRIGYVLKGSSISSVADGFGSHVAVNGNLAVVSAPDIDTGKGAVFAYDYNGTAWSQRPVLQPVNANGFGSDVTIVNGLVASGNKHAKEVSIFDYTPDQPTTANPALLMYLLN